MLHGLCTRLTCVSSHLCLCPDRAGSISTLDSLDFARYSDDGNRESDERVAGKTGRRAKMDGGRTDAAKYNWRWKYDYEHSLDLIRAAEVN